MPNIESAKKALRQTKRRTERNVARKKALKTVIKNFKKLIEQKKTDDAKQALVLVYKKLDKAAKVNLIKKNKASRFKSRLSQLINKSVKTVS